ncbi:PhnD/SsuA/transferrin family substrate-binding protein [Flavobacterium sp. IMCC34852]|uniref:PhnD/SsuA/transferrin family substrate-binding protein n=1 Tax=Flavobacterium rivulicola TaxID=2732161 RepID=A0A7Y3VYD5_9FLAO|nr:PhnD/SsuA/transferrin family substrate-binding protein [Flavobacterium sp. IMCC34852]NNT71580.1 PhnD/SsuA/transferrin family substrate-binding protein [Flavobacterium sp. IMCC34852]
MKTINLSYYPDITQYRSQEEIRAAVIVFSDLLAEDYSKRIGEEIKINVMPVMDVKTQTNYMADSQNECAIALMKPVSYILAQKKNQNLDVGAVAWRQIAGVESDTYLGQLFAHVGSGITKISDITKNHRIAYGDSFSTSNFLIPAMDLYKNGVHPFTGFRMAKFFGGHDGSTKAVYYLDADIGAGHDGAIDLLSMEKGFEDAKDKLKTVSKVDIYSDPVAVNRKFIPEVNGLTASLVAISSNPVVTKALQDFWGNVTRLGEADAKRYGLINDALDLLNLTDKDIL